LYLAMSMGVQTANIRLVLVLGWEQADIILKAWGVGDLVHVFLVWRVHCGSLALWRDMHTKSNDRAIPSICCQFLVASNEQYHKSDSFVRISFARVNPATFSFATISRGEANTTKD
jgi:hypothetical protein